MVNEAATPMCAKEGPAAVEEQRACSCRNLFPNASVIFRCLTEDGAIVTQFAPSAPHNLKQKEHTESVEQSPALSARAVDFIISAVRAVPPSDSLKGSQHLLALCQVSLMAVSVILLGLFCRLCDWKDFKNSAAFSSVQFPRSDISFSTCSRVSCLRVGRE